MSAVLPARLPWWAQLLRGLFALLMLATAIGKLLDMPGFYDIVASYRSLPDVLVPPSAWALTLAELGLSIWLVLGRRLPQAALVLIAMHAMYFGWTLTALQRGLVLSNCGCFGVYWARPLTIYSPLEDLVLVAMAALLWRAARRAGA